MREDKQEAIKMRIEGKSYSEISKTLNVPKSTLSYWLKDIRMTAEKAKALRERSSKAGFNALLKRNKSQKIEAKKRAEAIMKKSISEINQIDLENLRLIGSALYAGEGGKSKNRVDFTNSNPQIIKIIMRFFREVCEVNESKFRVQLAIHDKNHVDEAKRYWSRITGISQPQFIKVSLSVSKYSKKRRKNRLPYGTVQIRISDVELFHRIYGWIQGIIKKLEMPG